MNALIAIYPYKYQGLWVFDDPVVGLVQEPFVSGADVIIDRMTSLIADAGKGFRQLFFLCRGLDYRTNGHLGPPAAIPAETFAPEMGLRTKGKP